MPLRTRIRGLTTWVNFRLQPQQLEGMDLNLPPAISNVLYDLMTGSNLKQLVLSLTANDLPRFGSFDGLSKQQKLTRLQMAVDEFHKRRILSENCTVDVNKVAAHNAEHAFNFIWLLVCHDITFVAQRAAYLRQEDIESVGRVAFRWIPEPIPAPKKRKVQARNLIAGFGASIVVSKPNKEDQGANDYKDTYVPFPNDGIMTSLCQLVWTEANPADNSSKSAQQVEYIVEMVNGELATTCEGRKLLCKTLGDLGQGRVLCALINSFVPTLFPSEILLDDRWTVNLVLATAQKIFRMPVSSFDAEDLVESDAMAVCAYFCVFFMCAYRFRQCMLAASKTRDLRRLKRHKHAEFDENSTASATTESGSNSANETELSEALQLISSQLDRIDYELIQLAAVFDVELCLKWQDHADDIIKQVRREMRDKVKNLFHDVTVVGRDSTVDELCPLMKINLSLTNTEHGYYLSEYRETIKNSRKVIVRDSETGKYFWRKQTTVHKLLGLDVNNDDIVPSLFPTFQIFVEAQKYKKLTDNSRLLYQVFPTDGQAMWSSVIRAAIREDDKEKVDRLTTFFSNSVETINGRSTSDRRGDAALHVACRLGRHQMVEWLLERGADINGLNGAGDTPLQCACEAGHGDVASLLIEWGCDVDARGSKGALAALDRLQNEDIQTRLMALRDRLANIVPRIVDGAEESDLEQFIDDHVSGLWPLQSVRSRCIDGSTLLHSAVFFGRTRLAVRLLVLPGVDVHMLDYQGATALHRARCAATVRLLLEEGADVGAVDKLGNTPLHVKSYGETGRPSQLDAVRLLVQAGAKLDSTNHRRLTPIHCAAMQGRIDVIEYLLSADDEHRLSQAEATSSNRRFRSRSKQTEDSSPSVVHLAIVNEFVDCANWLVDHGFSLKTTADSDRLLRKLIVGQLKVTRRLDIAKFLIDRCGANLNRRYPSIDGEPEGRTLLHIAASTSDIEPTLIALLVNCGASVETTDGLGDTPLHVACRNNHKVTALELVRLGASTSSHNSNTGEKPFDCVADVDEWIASEMFDDELVMMLKASGRNQVRRLIRTITKKVRPDENIQINTISENERTQMELLNRFNDLSVSPFSSMWHRSQTTRNH